MAKHKEKHETEAQEAVNQTAEQAQRTGADILSISARMAERTVEQFSRALGAGRGELSCEHYARGLEVLADCGEAVARGYREISREYVRYAQSQMQTNLSALSRLSQCRSPQELMAAQNQLFGENVALALSANRRFAEIAKEMADTTAEKITTISDELNEDKSRTTR
jgi:hypothetical protein